MVWSVCNSKQTVSSLRNARGRFPSSFTFFGCRQKKKKVSQHEKSSIETFLNPAASKMLILYLWKQTVFTQKSYGKNTVFHLFFLFKVSFPDKEIMQTLSSAAYLIVMVWFASNKYVSDIPLGEGLQTGPTFLLYVIHLVTAIYFLSWIACLKVVTITSYLRYCRNTSLCLFLLGSILSENISCVFSTSKDVPGVPWSVSFVEFFYMEDTRNFDLFPNKKKPYENTDSVFKY